MTGARPPNILFLCTGNSCRSQMAEGWCQALYPDTIKAFSAGTTTHGMNSRAVLAMKESGVDISKHYSKSVADLKDVTFDIVFTVCSDADENCPVFSGARVIHAGFEDPPRLTNHLTREEDIMAVYRRVCAEIKSFVLDLPGKISRK